MVSSKQSSTLYKIIVYIAVLGNMCYLLPENYNVFLKVCYVVVQPKTQLSSQVLLVDIWLKDAACSSVVMPSVHREASFPTLSCAGEDRLFILFTGQKGTLRLFKNY